MTTPAWSAQQLAEYLAVVSSSATEASAVLAAVERAAEALDAEVGAIVRDGELVAAVGFPDGAAPVAELESVRPGAADGRLAVPGVGICPATAVSLEHPPGATLVVARCGGDGLSREETSLLRGMARVTSMTLRMLRLLDAERAARHESDRHAAENARLLATLTERQQMLERLAEEQARLRRVATLVAGQAAADDVFAAVAEEAARLLRADAGGLCRYEPDGSLLVMASWSERGAHIPTGTRLELEDNSIGATVLRSGGTARVDRYDRVSGRLAAFARELGIRSSVGAPVIVDGRVWGVMVAAASRREPLPSESEQRLACFTELVATAISNTQALGELRASRARVVAAADEVRRRIERNLHDGAQQRLVSLALMLRQAEATVPPEGDALRGTIASVYDDLNGVVTDLQEISRGLHPTILSQGGLQRALTTLARRSVVPVELHVGVDGRLPEPTEVTAYYVVAETLTNAAKHASASVVRVDVHRQNDELTVSVRDDGAGGADPAAGSGLVGLTDRVEALGGTISISSPPGDGTSLVVTVPIDAD